MKSYRICVALCVLAPSVGLAAYTQAAGQKAPPANVPNSAVSNSPRVQNPDTANPDNAGGLIIEPQELPDTYPHGPYHVAFHARGNYVPVLHWNLEKGALPPGMKLDDNGLLHGEAQRAGEFQFVIAVRDGNNPPQALQKAFVIKVVDAITLVWKVPAHVNVSRIEGSVDVTNTTVDDIDLTFDVKAIAENGRATEIGYQHFALKKGTIGMTLPFGETLPHGSYLVRVDVTGEVAQRNAIYRQALQTPRPLQVVPGP